jgi:lysophospholipase L1-like esterase
MNARTVAAMLAALVLGACGGGGSSEGPGAASVSSGTAANTGAGAALTTTAADAGAGTSTPPLAAPPNIALWGDSMIPGVARAFQYIWDRPVYDGGVGGETSTQIAARQRADTGHRDWISIFWYGHNNQDDAAQIKADIAASVAHLAPGNNRFIVLSVVNEANGRESRGSGTYQTIVQLNSELAAAYPQNYLDIRSYMVGQYDASNPQQLADFQNDLPSSSLRFDGIHLSGYGSEVVARKIREFIEAKGW